ncbi:MAG: transposase [Patescibacteria group bacterium]
MRKTQFQLGEYYHIYNRGVDKRDIFTDDKDYIRFIRSMREFNRPEPVGSLYIQTKSREPLSGSKSHLEANPKKLVDIICYSLIPNHIHLLLKQLTDNGISKFLHKLSMGYTHYFNYRYKRSGSLFQGTYNAIHVKTDEYLHCLSGYINGNPEIHKICKAEEWPWSSCQDYLGLRNGTLCNKNIILNGFKEMAEYRDYANIIINESGQRKDEVKKYLLE